MALWRANMSVIAVSRTGCPTNKQNYAIVANITDFDELYAMTAPIRAQMAASSVNINASTTHQPRFSLLSVHVDLTLQGASAPGGCEIEVYKVMPRDGIPYWSAVNTAAAQQNLLSNVILDSYSLYSTYPGGGTFAATFDTIGQTPYMANQVTASYKIKTLGRARLAPGGQRKFRINTYYKGGKEINLAGMATNTSGVNSPHTRMKPSHKPFYLLVRFWGSTGGDAATGATSVGCVSTTLISSLQVKYAYAYGLMSPVNTVYNTALGTATYATSTYVSQSGAQTASVA